jgi:hypothetical protein
MKPSTPGITPTPAKMKLPLRYQEESDAYTHIIRDRDNGHVVQFPQDSKGESESQARHFVEAVNSHASLVSRVTELEKALRELISRVKLSSLPKSSEEHVNLCSKTCACNSCILARAESVLEAKRAMEGK